MKYKFSELDKGKCFYIESDKTPKIKTTQGGEYNSHKPYNAVDIETGVHWHIDDDTEINFLSMIYFENR